jgi:hypothetical protein
MTIDSIFGLCLAIALFVILVVLTKLLDKEGGSDVSIPFSVFGFIAGLCIWGAVFVGVAQTDVFSAKSISWAEHNISKLEQKIENSDKEYDIIRYQTKIQKWEKNKEYYFDQIKANNKKAKE